MTHPAAYPAYEGTNADHLQFHFRMSGYDAGSNGFPLNPDFMHQIPYIQGYAAGILEWQKKLEKEEQVATELNWIFNPR
jgi:hypothetical protein